ncbi:proteoglycan 4-like [Lutzomyia longipalpis]|uniref:proteoglycan 4-like n=1 Tax=Lutzomyia longipalpis TaxID=7200 RepID=UPI002483EAEF|nr:proteoglycan 4-like [Lutzomyia longipalpis]
MTPPEIMCPTPPPPPPPLLATQPSANGHGDITLGRAELMQAIRNGTNLKTTPKEKSLYTQTSKEALQINGHSNGHSHEEPQKVINGMDKIQKELSEHFRAKENGTLPRKPPAMQPIVKRLLTEKPTESARKDDSERLMLSHGKRNFVVKKQIPATPTTNGCSSTNTAAPSTERPGKKKDFPVANESITKVQEDCKPAVAENSAKAVDVPILASTQCPDVAKKPAEAPEMNNNTSIKADKKIPTPLKPLQMPTSQQQVTKSPDITKIIKTPTTPKTPMSPQSKLKITHGKRNFTLPGRIKGTKEHSQKPTAEFLAVKLREIPNSPLQEATQQVTVDSPCTDTVNLPPFRSATLGRKREDPPPNPMVPAAPTYDAPKYDQKLVVSFAMDLAATPNRYPDRVKVSPPRASPEIPQELAQLRQKKFTIDPNRFSVYQD